MPLASGTSLGRRGILATIGVGGTIEVSRAKDMDYRADIDGLRAVAVLSVIAFHAFPERIPGGLVGVDIFFVISGFLISRIIFKSLEQGTFSFSEFYRRRIRRIFPALIVVLTACLAFGWLALLPDEYKQLAKHAAAAAAFISNLTLWSEAGYFDTSSAQKPLLHLWSLGIEEQFYLLWPACLVLLWKRKNRVLLTIMALAVLSFCANLVGVGGHPDSTFYLPFTRFWELLLGSILAFHTLFPEGSVVGLSVRWFVDLRRKTKVHSAIGFSGMLLIAVAILLFNNHRTYPGWWALLPTAGSALVIAAGPDAWANRAILRNPAMVLIGLISYPLYLWHWPLLSFARIVAAPTRNLKLALILASFVFAWITWRYGELRVRSRANLIGPKADIAIVSAALASICLFALLLFASNGAPSRTPEFEALAKDLDSPLEGHGYIDCRSQLPGAPPSNVRLPSKDQNRYYFAYCLQSKVGQPQATVVGDSHALRLFAGLGAIDAGRTWSTVGAYGCPPVVGVVFDGSISCAEKTQRALDYVIDQGVVDTVVISYFGYYGAPFRLIGDEGDQSQEDAQAKGFENTIQSLVNQRKRVFLMIDVPQLPFFPRNCIKRSFFPIRTNCVVERAVVEQGQQKIRRIVKQLKERFSGIVVFDPIPLICDDLRCNVVLDNFSYYLDDNHMSQRGSEVISRSLLALINRTAPRQPPPR